MAVSPTLEEKLQSLPTSPGCYLYKDDKGEIIYVGKAVNLRNRVRSYFQKGANHTAKTRKLVSRITDLDIIVVDSELEALVLECNLIKQHRPHYNVRLRDDKHYPYLILTMNEPFPRLLVTRQVKQDGGKYFGPFTNSRAVWDSLRLIYRLFPLVTCRKRWDNHAPAAPLPVSPHGPLPACALRGAGQQRRVPEDGGRRRLVPGRQAGQAGQAAARRRWTRRRKTCSSRRPRACATNCRRSKRWSSGRKSCPRTRPTRTSSRWSTIRAKAPCRCSLSATAS